MSGKERPNEGISLFIGQGANELEGKFGKPDRIDTSVYGYDWWIYNKTNSKYLQVGVEQGKVVTVYVIGEDVDISPFKIGQPVEEIYSSILIETEIPFELNDSSYRFELSEEDMNVRPLIRLGDIFVQLYFDKFSGTLSSVRFLDGPTLVKHRPYELIYRGELFDAGSVDGDEWAQAEEGSKKQIFDLTNIIRQRFDLNPLYWDEKTANVAYMHSKDMYDSNYFSHNSPNNGSVADRLDTAEVFYKTAGENIAAHYIDGPAVVEGWLNSKGHRETMLNDKFTHIGIGIYKKYYTQNFIQAWVE
ncbi:CAP domain-containing protein [Bacillus aquiflavi]|nr:CAP domain-containing protein [Bacillus aquiflavi]